MKNVKLVVLFLIFTGFSCATSNAGIATSNIPLADKKYKVLGHVSKTISWNTFDIGVLGFPLGTPPVNRLIQEAITEKQADALVNIHYWNDKSIFLFITRNRFGFEADAVKFE